MAKPAYRGAHERTRRALLPSVIGTPCPLCGTLLTRKQGRRYRASDAEFDHSTPLALGGRVADRFLCARCNRTAGASLGGRIVAAKKRRRRALLNPSRSW